MLFLKISFRPTYESTQKMSEPSYTPVFTKPACSKGKSYKFPL
jgi:hypothetical protein